MKSLDLVETDVADIHRAALTDGTDEAFVVVPSTMSIERLIAVLDDLDNPPTVRLLADEDALKNVMDDFLVASVAADLMEAGTLSIRTTAEEGASPLLITDGAVIAVVNAGAQVAGLATEEQRFVKSAREQYTTAWGHAPAYNLRTPPISLVRETLTAEFGEAVESDFNSVLASLETARGDGEGLDEVTISLLVAAKNELLLYDVSKWGEDVGVASKATFSRTKTNLEDMGLLDTQKVPIDVGRPRLRLLLGDERLRDADADDFASVTQGLLSGGIESSA